MEKEKTTEKPQVVFSHFQMSSRSSQEPTERSEEELTASREETEKLERYGHIIAWARETGLGETTIRNKLLPAPHILGIDEHGSQRRFYAETEVRKRIAMVLENTSLPKANEKGSLSWKGRNYATKWALTNTLDAWGSVLTKILEEVDQVEGAGSLGARLTFYCVEEVQEKLKLEQATWANTKGFLKREGKLFANRDALCAVLKITRAALAELLGDAEKVEGRDAAGRQRTFFLVEDVKRELDKRRTFQAKEGSLKQKGERYADKSTLRKEFSVSNGYLSPLLQDVKQVEGKNAKGLNCTYYHVEEVRMQISKDRESWANAEGILVREDGEYANKNAFQREFRQMSELDRLFPKIKQISGKDCFGHPCIFYNMGEVRIKLQEAMQSRVSEEGFLVIHGEQYAQLTTLIKLLLIDRETLLPFLTGVKSVERKNKRGKSIPCYHVEEVRMQISKDRELWANAEGILVREDGEYIHRSALMQEFQFDSRLMGKLLEDVEHIVVKDQRGKQRTLYQKKTARMKLDEERQLRGNEEGILQRTEGNYLHLSALTRALKVKVKTIRPFLADAQKFEGKGNKGRPVTFYLIEDIRQKLEEWRSGKKR